MPQNLMDRLKVFAPKSVKQGRVRNFMIRHIGQLSSLSLDDIAAETGTSQPMVTRVMRDLGYKNSLELRAAAVTAHQRGRLPTDQVKRAAELIHDKDDLFIFATAIMDDLVDDIFRKVFPKTIATLPMKPHIQPQRENRRSTANIFGDHDAMLVLAIGGLPGGYDFDALFQHAEYRGVTIVILQAISCEAGLGDGVNVFSLGLDTTVPETLAAIYLGAAVAEIRHLAEGAQ